MEIVFEYEPRIQFVPFHERRQRWACLVVHRRGGKTVACINDLIARAAYTQKKNARYAYIAPYYRQAKDVAWMYLKDYVGDAAVKVKESELSVELFNGAKITLYGADNPDALRGIYLDGVILDEYGDCRPSLWAEVILPTLSDRTGWATFIGTPKGKNHFFLIRERAKKEENWFYAEHKASDTGILPEEELGEIRALQTEDQYAQEMECSFEAAVTGTYYASTIAKIERDGQIQESGPVWDPDLPVHVSQDLGFTDSTSLWFWQHRPDGIAFIDYEEAHSQPLSYYFDLLNYKGYEYEVIWLPHDARAKSLQTGRSTIEQYLDAGFPCRITPKLSIQHGIDAARSILPSCWFNLSTCADGVEALRAYRRNYNEVSKSFSDAPLHDWSSHGADSFRYASLVAKERLNLMSAEERLKDSVYRPPGYTLNQLFSDRERSTRTLNRGRI